MLLATILFVGIGTIWVESRWALSIFQVAIFSLAAARVVARVRDRRSFGYHPIAILLAGCVVWGLLQLGLSTTVNRFQTIQLVLNWIAHLSAVCLAFELCSQRERGERFLNACLIFGALLSVVAIFTFLTSPAGKVFWRFDVSPGVSTLGPFVYKNQFAAFVETVLPVAVFRALRDSRYRLAHTFVAATLFGSVVASGSRIGSIVCLGEIVLIPIIALAQKIIGNGTLWRVLLASAGAAAAMTAIMGWQTIWDRLQEPHPYALRWELVKSSAEMVRDRPLSGFGLGAWADAYPAYARYDDGTFVNQAHNDWVQWAAEGGIPFLFLVLAIASVSVRSAVHSIFGIGIAAVFLHGLMDYPFQQRPALASYFFAWLGVAVASRNWDKGFAASAVHPLVTAATTRSAKPMKT